MAVILSTGIIQGFIHCRPRGPWRQNIVDFSGAISFALIAFKERRSKRLIVRNRERFYETLGVGGGVEVGVNLQFPAWMSCKATVIKNRGLGCVKEIV